MSISKGKSYYEIMKLYCRNENQCFAYLSLNLKYLKSHHENMNMACLNILILYAFIKM